MKLANFSELRDGVNEVFAGNEKYFIHKIQDKIKVYSSICPHQGGQLFCKDFSAESSADSATCGAEIYCKVHNWRFDANSGKSSNIKSATLREVKFVCEESGEIYLDSALDSATISTNRTQIAESKHFAKSSIKSPNFTHSAPPPICIFRRFAESRQFIANSAESRFCKAKYSAKSNNHPPRPRLP